MRPTIDEYLMDMARRVASRSTCVRRSVGCVLVNRRNHILATGYNGVASGERHCNEVARHVSESRLMFPDSCAGANAHSGSNLDACNAIHAEQNAILQCGDAYSIERAYVTAFPCPTCLKLLLNTSCRVIAYDEEYGDMSGHRMWIGAGRVSYRVNGAPHMIQADLMTLFGRDGLSAWRVLVACVCLNVCSARAARGVVFRVLNRWPDPDSLAASGDDLERLLQPLGLSERRGRYLRGMSDGYARGEALGNLPGVGAYAVESVRVFVGGELPEDVGDRKVAAYVEWRREQSLRESAEP